MKAIRATIGALAALAAGLAGAGGARAADFAFPQSGPCTSNYYSARSYGNHGALDIAGPNVSAVTAARAGRIRFYGVSGGYGNLMILTHEAGYETYYAHLSSAARAVGSNVNLGDTIAYEGSTGNSTGPHVHFEVRRYGTKQFVPGSVGAYFTRGNGLPHDYPGIGDSGQTPGAGTPPPAGGGAPTAGDHGAWRITASALNVRTCAGTGNAIMGVIPAGQVYISEQASGAWKRIWFDGRMGWSHGDYLARASATGRIVETDGLNVRSGPGTGYGVVAVVGRGRRYVEAGRSGDGVKIYFGGTTRWFHGAYTRAAGY